VSREAEICNESKEMRGTQSRKVSEIAFMNGKIRFTEQNIHEVGASPKFSGDVCVSLQAESAERNTKSVTFVPGEKGMTGDLNKHGKRRAGGVHSWEFRFVLNLALVLKINQRGTKRTKGEPTQL